MKKVHRYLILFTHMLLGINLASAQIQINKQNYSNRFNNPPHFGTLDRFGSSLNKKAIKQRLDSVVNEDFRPNSSSFSPSSKALYSFDYNGNLTSQISKVWNDSKGGWKNNTQRLNNFNSRGLISSDALYNWDTLTNTWKGVYRDDYFYDNSFNITNMNLYRSWDYISNSFVLSNKIFYFLNTSGKVISEIDSAWDSSNNLFFLSNKFDYFYDSIGNQNVIIAYNYDGKIWTPASKSEYTYNNKGNILEALNTIYNNGIWQNGSKYEYVYNSNEDVISQNGYLWNAQSNKWDNYNKSSSTYDVNFNPISNVNSTWNNTNQSWEYTYKNDYIFDGNGNMTNELYYDWNPNTNQWVGNQQYNYNFNNTYSSTDLVWDMGSIYFKHMITDGIVQHGVGSSWVNSYKFTAYYSVNDFNGIKEPTINSTSLYPNPTSSLITITSARNITTINVFRITGELVYSTPNITKQENIQLDFSSLSNGIYYVQSTTINGEVGNHKVLLSK